MITAFFPAIPTALRSACKNLIENAIKYGDGRRIEISFEKMDGCELITVSNTGCTLEAKELPQIFESFHRGNNADKVQGNGLGLFICKRLMSLMGGEVYTWAGNAMSRKHREEVEAVYPDLPEPCQAYLAQV